MGLYLCVFAPGNRNEELDAVEVGSYGDFGRLRDTITTRLEPNGWGSRFPTLMLHVDNDGEWTPDEAVTLERELAVIDAELAALPPEPLPDGWQSEVAREFDITPVSLRDCFFDVNGDPLLGRMIDLCRVSIKEDVPILFQ
jgi:hypothetical protein